ncbi:MAG: hypothetical protein IPO69_09115 [Saprospiraceae bacterium]|nr:hypothetical protein [Saprospiraceae bacterium]
MGGRRGGAIWNDIKNSNLILINCILSGNTASFGGAVVNYGFLENRSTFKNCIISNNKAIKYGGAVYNSGKCNPTFLNCIFGQM